MRKTTLLAIMSMVAGLLWITTPPSQAAGESWSITDVNASGCAQNQWSLDIHYDGLVPNGTYVWHTRLVSDGKIYMDEGFDHSRPTSSGDDTWTFYEDYSYPGPEPLTHGTWPLTPGKKLTATFTLENGQGFVISSWTLVAQSCDSTAVLYNGPTAADQDGDYIATPTDKCPTLASSRANGCPLRDRSLTLAAKYGPKRLVGKLVAPGFPKLYAGRTVTIWKVRTGPDRKVASLTASSTGFFKVRVRKGRYYATSRALVVPTAGQVTADRSPIARVH